MSCERAKELMIDALVEPLGSEQARELEQHVATCDSCAKQMAGYQELWQQLETVAIPEPSAGGLERLQQAVREEFGDAGGPRAKAARPSGLPLIQRLAAAVALVAIGALLSFGLRDFTVDTGMREVDDRQRYVFIMTATQETPDMSEAVQAEVDAWIGELLEQDVIETGFGIFEGTPVGTPRSGSLLNGPVSGFMIIRAADAQEARRIALDSPIITYGGLIEIREIDDGDSGQ